MVFFGNNDILKQLESMSLSENLAHAYLFVGPEKIGKTTFAQYFANRLLCDENCGCGNCPQCRVFAVNNHPDYQVFDDDNLITVEQTRELIRYLDLKPYQAKRKVAVIANAERMTTSAANSLLKTLEEPSLDTVIIMTTTNPDALLPTIKSRVQIVKFKHISKEEIAAVGAHYQHENFENIAKIAAGKVGLIYQLIKDEKELERFMTFIQEFESVLADKSYYNKIKFAEKLAKEKTEINNMLSLLEGYYREKMIEDESVDKLKISLFLDKLTETRSLIKKNVNKQLALEALMFNGV